MKSVVSFLIALCLLGTPALVPSVTIGPTAQGPDSPAAFTVGGCQVTVGPGGSALAWNLLAECCIGGSDFCCGIYERGVDQGWW
jgi:hypothetical protein